MQVPPFMQYFRQFNPLYAVFVPQCAKRGLYMLQLLDNFASEKSGNNLSQRKI